MSSVQIAQENLSIANGRNLAPFVSTAEFYAQIYNADIVLHACNGNGARPIEDNRVHIYVFAYPVDPTAYVDLFESEPKKMFYAKSIYGFALPSDQVIAQAHGHPDGNVGVFIKTGSAWRDTKVINAPERIEVARVLRTRHLWILFDMARKPWDGDRIVFGRIMEEAQRTLFDAPLTFDLRQRSRLTAESCRTELVANAASLRAQFISAARRAAEEAAEASRHDIEKNIAQQVKAGQALKVASRDLQYRESALKNLNASLPDDDILGKDFDDMLSWKNVRGVRVENDSVILTTGLVVLERPSKKLSLPSTEHEIEVSFASLTNRRSNNQIKDIHFRERAGAWRGPWRHPLFSDRGESLCFGKFADAMCKCLTDCRIRDLFHLLLFFLIFDARDATRRESNDFTKKDLWPSTEPYEPPTRPFYLTPGDRQNERNAYIALAKRCRFELVAGPLQKEINELRSQAESLGQRLIEMRREFWVMQEIFNEETNTAHDGESQETEFTNLMGNPALCGIVFGTGWIEASFVDDVIAPSDNHSYTAHTHVLLRPAESYAEIRRTLWGPQRIIFQTLRTIPGEIILGAAKHTSMGMLGSALKYLHDHSRAWAPPAGPDINPKKGGTP
ncbi:MAG: hypothetical protein Q8Q39_00460 [bacterium]|nr:hypothetical protein [bacterium]